MDSLEKEMDVEELHDLRVTHKRIRAFFRLLNKIDQKLLPTEEDYNYIKRFYKIAGKLRDIHVQAKEMRKHEQNLGMDLSFIHTYINDHEKAARKNFESALKEFDRKVFDRYEEHLKNELKKKEIFTWYKQVVDFTFESYKKVEKRIEKATTAKKLHKVRSNLKDIFYYMEIINSEDTFEDISDQEVKDAQSFLGDWHDHVVSYEFLQEFKKEHPQIADKNRGSIEILEDYLIQKIHFN